MRRAARVDDNHVEVKAAFRKLGCSVLDLAGVGAGCPDIAVGYAGLTALVEIKDGTKTPSARKLTEAQQRFKNDWTGGVRLVENLEDVASTVSTLRKWHNRLCAL